MDDEQCPVPHGMGVCQERIEGGSCLVFCVAVKVKMRLCGKFTGLEFLEGGGVQGDCIALQIFSRTGNIKAGLAAGEGIQGVQYFGILPANALMDGLDDCFHLNGVVGYPVAFYGFYPVHGVRKECAFIVYVLLGLRCLCRWPSVFFPLPPDLHALEAREGAVKGFV